MSDWITINPTSGCNDGSVSFTASKNTTGADRSAKYRIYNDDYGIEKYVTITQPVTGNTKIYYTSTDGNIVTPSTLSATDASGNSLTFTNTYSNGQGIIEFSGVVKDIEMRFRGTNAKSQTLKTFDGISNRVSLLNLNYVFTTWKSLESIDFSNFDTSNATSMLTMTSWIPNLKTFKGLSNLNTSKVTTMKFAFKECGLDTLDLSGWNTSSVTDMSYMFYSCFSSTINISNFDTSKVTNMKGMFTECFNLTSLDLSNFDTSKVTDMSGMFYKTVSELYPSILTSLKIGPNCIIGSSTTTTQMFDGLPSSGTLYYPTGMDSTQVAKWTPSGWTAVTY